MPVYLYESVIDMIEGQARILFVKLPYTLATEEAERIGLDHVARIVSGGESSSSKTADQLTAQHSAIKMLAGRVKLILQYVQVQIYGFRGFMNLCQLFFTKQLKMLAK